LKPAHCSGSLHAHGANLDVGAGSQRIVPQTRTSRVYAWICMVQTTMGLVHAYMSMRMQARTLSRMHADEHACTRSMHAAKRHPFQADGTLEISAQLRRFFPSESHPRRRIRFQAGLERVKFDRLLWQTRARVEIFRARPYNL